MNTHVLACYRVDDIVWWSSKKFRDDGKLVHMVLAREQRLSFKHLGEYTARTPDINFDIILLPGEHDFRCPIVSCGDIASHLRILDTSQAKVAYFKIAVLIDKDVAWFQVSVDHASRVHIF